jgi:hypothetical protein
VTGHGVAVLLKIYAHCIDGQGDAANQHRRPRHHRVRARPKRRRRRRQRSGILKWQVSSQTLSGTVNIPLLRTVSTPLLPSPSVAVRGFRALGTQCPRTNSGRRKPENTPRNAYVLVSGG